MLRAVPNLRVSTDDFGDLAQICAAFPRRPLLPAQVRGVRLAHRQVHLDRSGALDHGDGLAGGGVLYDELVVGGCRRPAGSGSRQRNRLLSHAALDATLTSAIGANDRF